MKKGERKILVLDQGTCIYGAGVLLKHVQALKEETASIQTGEKDIEFIHRARVASRRLRAAMPLFNTCLKSKKTVLWQKHIRDLTRALGEARDADVQIERLEKFLTKDQAPALQIGIRRLILRLRQHRRRLQPSVESAVQDINTRGVLDQMEERFTKLAAQSSQVYIYTPILYQHSFQSISARLDEFLSYSPYVTQPEKVAELHEMRIRAKWLRYTTETFAEIYSSELKTSLQAIRKVQEQLGDIHDCDVWNEYLPRFLEEEHQRTLDYYDHTRFFGRLVPGIEFFRQNRVQARSEQYAEFVNDWQNLFELNTWEELRQSIQVPFPNASSVFPPTALEQN